MRSLKLNFDFFDLLPFVHLLQRLWFDLIYPCQYEAVIGAAKVSTPSQWIVHRWTNLLHLSAILPAICWMIGIIT